MSCQEKLMARGLQITNGVQRDVLYTNIFENYELHFFGAKFAKSIHFFRPEMVGISHFF